MSLADVSCSRAACGTPTRCGLLLLAATSRFREFVLSSFVWTLGRQNGLGSKGRGDGQRELFLRRRYHT